MLSGGAGSSGIGTTFGPEEPKPMSQVNGTQIAKRVRNSDAHRAARIAMVLAPGREYGPRRVCRDNATPMWPERALGRDPAINLAEVERALSRPARSKCTAPALSRAATQTAKADRRRTSNYSGPPADIGQPPIMPNGKKMTFTQAAQMRGVSAVAMWKRVHRYGWSEAMKMTIRGGSPLR